MLDSVNIQAAVPTPNNFQDQNDRFGLVTSNSEHEGKVNETRYVRTVPGQQETGADGRQRDSFELSQEAEEIRKLQVRDREVRAHEAAHAAAGGAYAGSPSYTFKRGPDGQSYATGGEVSIDVSSIKGDPQATLQKAQQVRAAALAPAEPSAQDMKVAQRAQSMAAKARMELSEEVAKTLYSLGANAVLLKGGHLKTHQISDLLYDGKKFTYFKKPRIENKSVHGTGCALSAAITANLAKNKNLFKG